MEEDVFKIIVPLVAESEISERKYSSERSPEEIKKDSVRDIKNGGTTQKTTQKITQKTTQKILELIKENPHITRRELAGQIGITEDGIKYHLGKMKEKGILKRIGPDKGGYWEVVE